MKKYFNKNTKNDMDEIFTKMDKDRNGEIDAYEFQIALEKIGLPINKEESKRLIKRFSVNGTTIKYKEFMKAFTTSSSKSNQETDEILIKIRKGLIDYLGPGSGSARKIKETFTEMDRDHSGRVDKQEFEKAMSVLKISLDRDDTRLLFERFDKDRNGLDYQEFLDLLKFNSDVSSETDIILAKIKKKLIDYLGPGASSARKIKEVFAEMDRNNNGTIDKREFEKAMIVLGVNVTSNDIQMLFQRFDRDKNGLDYKEFLDLVDYR